LKPQINGTTGPPSVNDNGSGFPMKSIALQHVAVTKTDKVAKGKKTNAQYKQYQIK